MPELSCGELPIRGAEPPAAGLGGDGIRISPRPALVGRADAWSLVGDL